MRLELLGPFRLTADTGEILVTAAKQKALLAYLACTAPQLQPRDQLLELLWGGRFDTQARQSLRQAVSRLRRAVGTNVIVQDQSALTIDVKILKSDYEELQRLKHAQSAEAAGKIAALWRGEFLQDLSIPEPAFETWLETERRRVREVVVDALRDLAAGENDRGNTKTALDKARTAVALEPFRDDLRRVVMEALWKSGRSADALRHFNDYADQLQKDLQTVPAAETRELAQRIRSGEAVPVASAEIPDRRVAYDEVGEHATEDAESYNAPRRMSSRLVPVAMGIALALTLLAGLVLWQPWTPEAGLASVEQPAHTLSEKPSIAVLPFDAYHRDAATTRLARGLTEDIITDLARFPEFGVIARNSTEIYGDMAVDARAVGAELGVDYVVEGSIQREGQQLRITAQLIDTSTGGHLWSERWDRTAGDLFAIQTEIAEKVTNRLGGGAGLIQQEGRTKAKRKRPSDLDAYELYLLGTEKLEQLTGESISEAIRLLSRAVEVDPGLARAWVELYHAHNLSRYYGADREIAMTKAAAAANTAISLDPSDAEAHAVHAMALVSEGEPIRAKAEFDTALRMAPNSFEILALYAGWAGDVGVPERGPEFAERAISVNPDFPTWAAAPFAWAFFNVGRYEDTVRMLDRLAPESYATWRWGARGASLAALGRMDEAAETVRQALEYFPDLTIEGVVNNLGLPDSQVGHWIETMRLAGFPPCVRDENRSVHAMDVQIPECEATHESKK